MRFAADGETGWGDKGIEFGGIKRPVPSIGYLAVQGPSPEEAAKDYTIVPYSGTESEEDLPKRVEASNSFMVDLPA